jgi:putative flippase GtrA
LRTIGYRALSFAAVGLVSSGGYVATLTVGVEKLAFPVVVSAFLAFCVGTLVSYIGNTLLTFRASMGGSTLWRFLSVVTIGMALNQAIAYALDRMGAHYLFVALTVFVIIPAFNFAAHSAFTYRLDRA